MQQPSCLCALSAVSDKPEGMSLLKPHRSSTQWMRRRTGCGRGCAQRSRAQPGTWSSSLHDLLACLAFLDGTTATRRFGSTLLGCSHSPTSAFLHCHHSFSGASNRTVGKSQSTAICRRAFFSGCVWQLAPGITRKSGDDKKYTGNLCARVLADPHRCPGSQPMSRDERKDKQRPSTPTVRHMAGAFTGPQ